MYPPMMGRRHFNVMPLPEQLPLLPTKPPAADEGAQFDMSFEPLGGDYAAKYYQQAFKGMLPQVQSSAPLDSMSMGISPEATMAATYGKGPGGGNTSMGANWWDDWFDMGAQGGRGGGSPMMGLYKGWF